MHALVNRRPERTGPAPALALPAGSVETGTDFGLNQVPSGDIHPGQLVAPANATQAPSAAAPAAKVAVRHRHDLIADRHRHEGRPRYGVMRPTTWATSPGSTLATWIWTTHSPVDANSKKDTAWSANPVPVRVRVDWRAQ